MNTNPTTVNTVAATAVIAVFLLFATLFGTPGGSPAAQTDPGMSWLHVSGQ